MTSEILVWRGIRFARLAHPFAAPETVQGTDVRSPGGQFGAAPLQTPMPIPGFSLRAEMSWDCLFLNVWAPANASELPVVLYFYGGGFEGGAASVEWFDGASLSEGAQCVVVTANYRVGAYGFADFSHHGGPLTDAHNLGLQDARAALEWTVAHIGDFGGDPKAMTVIGQSSGAFLAAALLASPGLPPVRAMACFSGGTSRIIASQDAKGVADAVLKEAGLENSPDAVISAPPHVILAAQGEVTPTALAIRNGFRPRGLGVALDKDSRRPLVPRHPLDAVAAGSCRATFILAAATVDEADGFPASVVDTPSSSLAEGIRALVGPVSGPVVDAYEQVDVHAAWRRVLGDYIYRLPAARLVQAQREAGGHAAYLEVSRVNGERAPHGAEIPGVFARIDSHRDAAIHGALVEVIHTGSISGGAVDAPLVAGDRDQARVHTPAELLSIWAGVDRP